jgi:hypothetical protein
MNIPSRVANRVNGACKIKLKITMEIYVIFYLQYINEFSTSSLVKKISLFFALSQVLNMLAICCHSMKTKRL